MNFRDFAVSVMASILASVLYAEYFQKKTS